jgi:hypothetical protein
MAGTESMMGPRQVEQGALFYNFSIDAHVPADHLLRSIDRFVDLSELRRDLAPFYSSVGRPSIDPELMIRMQIIRLLLGSNGQQVRCGIEADRRIVGKGDVLQNDRCTRIRHAGNRHAGSYGAVPVKDTVQSVAPHVAVGNARYTPFRLFVSAVPNPRVVTPSFGFWSCADEKMLGWKLQTGAGVYCEHVEA